MNDNLCSHCDCPTTAILGVCYACIMQGHTISVAGSIVVNGPCAACRQETLVTIIRLERVEGDNIYGLVTDSTQLGTVTLGTAYPRGAIILIAAR